MNMTSGGNSSAPYNWTSGVYNGSRPRADSPFADIRATLDQFVLPIICAFGVLGNSLILLILTRYRMRRTVTSSEMVVHAGLLSMAVSDLLFNVSLLPRAFIPDDRLLLPAGSFALLYNLYSVGLITTFSLSSTWLIVVTSGLRYIGVCHPLQARSLVSHTAILTCIGAILVLCVLANIPQFFLSAAVDLGGDMMLIDMGPWSHAHLRGLVYAWLRAVFSIFLPGLLLIYFNTRLLLALAASRRLHRSHVRRSVETARRETGNSHRLTRTLVAVIAMFILLVYPTELIDFFTYIAPVVDIRDSESVLIARAATNILQVSNFSFNFLLYYVMNGPFRRTAKEVTCSLAGAVVRLARRASCSDHGWTPAPTSAREHDSQKTVLTMSTKLRRTSDRQIVELSHI